MSAPTPLTRAAVYKRDGNRCVTCGEPSGLSFQHRRASGMGGSSIRPGAADGVTACLPHNERYEGDLQATALAYGWKVRKWANPTLVPLYVAHEWRWYRLEGTERIEITAVVALDMMHAVYGDEYMRWFEEAKG